MKNITKIFAIALVALGFSTSALAQGVTKAADAKAFIKTAITLTNVNPLEFGKMAVTGTAGTVLLSTAGIPTATNVQLLGATPRTAASYTATGDPLATYAITIPTSPLTINGPSSATMTVSSFQCSKGATSAFDNAGADAFTVGATLNVGATQTAGAYAGSFNVSIDYN